MSEIILENLIQIKQLKEIEKVLKNDIGEFIDLWSNKERLEKP